MLKKLTGKIFIAIIKLYQLTLSPLLMSSCRYTPTCSCYGVDAIRHYGPFKGGYLTVKRVLSCHPWGGHGYDPVTMAETKSEEEKN